LVESQFNQSCCCIFETPEPGKCPGFVLDALRGGRVPPADDALVRYQSSSGSGRLPPSAGLDFSLNRWVWARFANFLYIGNFACDSLPVAVIRRISPNVAESRQTPADFACTTPAHHLMKTTDG
jgi:hypothetical protein